MLPQQELKRRDHDSALDVAGLLAWHEPLPPAEHQISARARLPPTRLGAPTYIEGKLRTVGTRCDRIRGIAVEPDGALSSLSRRARPRFPGSGDVLSHPLLHATLGAHA